MTKKEIGDCLFVGEPSLAGGIRGVRGRLLIALEARGRKIPRLVVAEASAKEAVNGGRNSSVCRVLIVGRDSLG